MSGRRASGGFTLIEVVIAIAVVAIITSFVYAALTGVLRSAKIAGAKNEVATLGNSVVSMIADDLAVANADMGKTPSGDGAAFHRLCGMDDREGDGDTDTLAFTTAGGEITYRVEYDYQEDEYVLWRRTHNRVEPLKDQFRRGWTTELLRGRINSDETYPYKLLGVDFSYCLTADQMQQGRCVEEYPCQDGVAADLPKAVRIALTVAGPSFEALRFITVAPVFMKMDASQAPAAAPTP